MDEGITDGSYEQTPAALTGNTLPKCPACGADMDKGRLSIDRAGRPMDQYWNCPKCHSMFTQNLRYRPTDEQGPGDGSDSVG